MSRTWMDGWMDEGYEGTFEGGQGWMDIEVK
jgi:hypothetical protein